MRSSRRQKHKGEQCRLGGFFEYTDCEAAMRPEWVSQLLYHGYHGILDGTIKRGHEILNAATDRGDVTQ